MFDTELQKKDINSQELITREVKSDTIHTIEKVEPVVEIKVIQTRRKTEAQNEKVEQEVKVHQMRSREKSSPLPKPINTTPYLPKPKPKPIDASDRNY